MLVTINEAQKQVVRKILEVVFGSTAEPEFLRKYDNGVSIIIQGGQGQIYSLGLEYFKQLVAEYK